MKSAKDGLPPTASNAAVAAAAATPVSQIKHTIGSSFVVPGLYVTDHTFSVPLDYVDPSKGSIKVFVRELVAPNRAKDSLPYLLYLQGGPGFESPRPCEASIWIKSAVNHFRVILMDQRGTGLSTPVTTASLLKKGPPEAQAAYLEHFRADSIVVDAETVRRVMVPADGPCAGRWTALGQSFGGFCCVTYLSLAPHGLYEVLLTGGLPPAILEPCGADEAYRALFPRVLAQNKKYYSRYPGDVAVVGRIVRTLAAHPEGGPITPAGNRLTVRSFQMLGLGGLGSGGGFERLHYLLERAFDGEPDSTEIGLTFMKGFDSQMTWDTNPLYAILHESIYCQGAASRWAAQRVLDANFAEVFDAVKAANSNKPPYFTGEMVFPSMFDDFAALRPIKEAASIIAAKDNWPCLYDVQALESSMVPVASATYVEDMYVDFNLAQGTAGHIQGIRQWMTNEFMHSGVRDDGARIFEQLLGMTRGSIPIY